MFAFWEMVRKEKKKLVRKLIFFTMKNTKENKL